MVDKELDIIIEEVENAVACAKKQPGEALNCTAEWLEMVLDELKHQRILQGVR